MVILSRDNIDPVVELSNQKKIIPWHLAGIFFWIFDKASNFVNIIFSFGH